MHALPFDQLVTRIKSEYVEMPGLWLTPEQGARLWALERTQCEELLTELVSQHFLTMRADGKYGRMADDHTRGRLPAANAVPLERTSTGVPEKLRLP
jgi:hypothetical protein